MDILDVEKSKCIGCGACVSIDDEHFDFDDDGLSEVISNDNLKSERLKDAIESCPTNAIRLAKGDEEFDPENNEAADYNNGATVMASSNLES